MGYFWKVTIFLVSFWTNFVYLCVSFFDVFWANFGENGATFYPTPSHTAHKRNQLIRAYNYNH